MKENNRKRTTFEHPAAEIIKLEDIDILTESGNDTEDGSGEDKDPDQGAWVNFLQNKN